LALRGTSTKVYGFGREAISLRRIHLLYFFYSSRGPWGFSNTCAEIMKLSGGSSSK
jgi:RNase P/RNase MRP subunit p30